MKKTLVVIMVTVASIAMAAGVVSAASAVYDSLTVGSQGVGGVTYFNGSIINNTTTNGVNNPVTFADNVRIDGRVHRGATYGPGDTMPFIVNDDMEITGDLTVAGNVTAATFQQMINETVGTTGQLRSAAATTPSTWTGTIYDVCQNAMRETAETVTFTPTDENSGTWTSSPINIFNAGAVCMSEDIAPRGTSSGSYQVKDNLVFAFNVTLPNGDSHVGYTAMINFTGNQATITDTRTSPQPFAVLTRQ